MGGLSAEREVSLKSGQSVVKALNNLGCKVSEIDPSTDLPMQLKQVNPDVVFNALHGTYGEDGAIPGLLEVMQIPYTHSGIMASAVGMNKAMTRHIAKMNGVLIPEGKVIRVEDLCPDTMAVPFVLKPIQQGSSVGVYIINQDTDTQAILKEWVYGEEALVEEYIAGKELSIGVFNDKALGILELRPKEGFYDYKAKYTAGVTDHIYPAEIPEPAYNEAMALAERMHKALECRTLSRSDFRYDPSRGKAYFLEINTHPGFTSLSIVPELAGYQGISFEQMVQALLEQATCDLSE
jgi:D-alanine-D-alanine ligase